MAWSLIHAAWMHILLAVINAHDWTMVGLFIAFSSSKNRLLETTFQGTILSEVPLFFTES